MKTENEYPLVSVVCVSMNHARYIQQALESFISQSYPNIEILYLDNCSSDETFEIAREVLKDSPFSYQCFKREKSYNLPQNFNFLIDKAKGEYLSFISCDDWLKPECISKMLEVHLQNSNTGLVYGNGWYFWEDSNTYALAANKKFISGKIFDHVFEHGVLFPVGVMIRKKAIDAVGWYDENIPIEDYDMWLRIATKFEIGYCAAPLIYYRKHSKSMTGVNGYTNIKYYLQIVEKYKEHRLYKRVCRKLRQYTIYKAYLNKRKKEALQLLLRDFRLERFYCSVLLKLLFLNKRKKIF